MPGALTPRIALACVYHESNSFASARTNQAHFAPWRVGAEILDLRGTQTVTGGFLDGCAAQGIDPIPTFYAWATPSGVVEAETFDDLERALVEHISAAGPLDGLLLELHGGMVAAGRDRADARLARAARQAAGPNCVIVAVLDPHANVHADLAAQLDVVLAYQQNPHVDMNARGVQGVDCLMRALADDRRPSTVVEQVPIIAAPIAQATADQPLRDLVERAAQLEAADPDLLAASIVFGYAYADVEDVGMAVMVAHFDAATGSARASELAAACWAARDGFARDLVSPEAALELVGAGPGLAVIAETGDNIGAGASGAATAMLSAVLDRPDLAVALTLFDPATVAAAQAAGVGAEIEVRAGVPAVDLTATVTWLGHGRYTNRGPLSAGVEFDMGPIAILQCGRSTCLVGTNAVMANDQNMLRSFGIDPTDYDAIVLKGAAAIRAGWQDLAPRFIDAGTVGETPYDLAGLPYRRRRPRYPLDDVEAGHAG